MRLSFKNNVSCKNYGVDRYMDIKRVVIIIPTYNEEQVIKNTITSVFQAVADIDTLNVEILIFDSNSTDDTQAIVTALQQKHEKLYMQTEPCKTGLGSAYLKAMHYAIDELKADIIIEFDADLSHQPAYIPVMLEAIQEYDVVIGSRYIKGGSIPDNWGWHRKLLSVMGNLVSRVFLSTKYKDFTSGFRATRVELLKKILPKKFISSNYAYKLELLWLLHKEKASILEYPIQFVDREKGQSKLPANSIIDSLYVLGKLRFNELKQYIRMCMVGISGMSIQFLVYNLLREIISPFNAAQFAVLSAIISNYTFNHRYTFKNRRFRVFRNKVKSFTWFLGYSLSMIIFQSHWLKLGIKYWGSGTIKENIVMISGIIAGSILNYQIYSRLVWPRHITKGLSIHTNNA